MATGPRGPFGTALQHPAQPADDPPLALMFHSGKHPLSGQGAGDQDFFVALAADADPFVIEAVDVDFEGRSGWALTIFLRFCLGFCHDNSAFTLQVVYRCRTLNVRRVPVNLFPA